MGIVMTDTLPPCPECASVYTYAMDALLVCPECGHEWSAEADTDAPVVRDSVGNVLVDGDTVTVIKDLKVKGSSSVVWSTVITISTAKCRASGRWASRANL